MTQPLLILGSSSDKGLGHTVVEAVLGARAPETIDLQAKTIGYYDYGRENMADDFIKVAERMAAADSIVFATPVYWYSMSAQMKTLFDRFTDLITLRKDLGRKFKGKRCFVLAWGNDAELPAGFDVPFSSTAAYFDMAYGGCFYYCTGAKADVERRSREAVAFGRAIAF